LRWLPERSCGLDDLAGPQAPRAHANAFAPTADDGTNDLKIRLESSRAHVMRMAHCSPDDRSLPANLTTPSHGGTP
jgi:hypothetical protein